MSIKFVYFDIGNVFMTFDKIFTRVCRDFKLNIDEFDKAYSPYDVDANLGRIDIPEVWIELCRKLKIKDGEKYNLVESWVSDYEIIKPTHDFARRLAGIYKMGVLSNYYRGYFEEAMRQDFIPDIQFDVKIISAEVGAAKPDSQIYQIAEERCGVKPEEILFLDDKSEIIRQHAHFIFTCQSPRKIMGWLDYFVIRYPRFH